MEKRTAPLVTELRRACEDVEGNWEAPRTDVKQPACTEAAVLVITRPAGCTQSIARTDAAGRSLRLIAWHRSLGRPSVHKFDAAAVRRRDETADQLD